MKFPIYQVVFFLCALLAVASAFMVVISRNPVRAILFLILSFFACAVLWMLLQAEFLSLVLIFVYVGAVMTLFLFVVMMLNIDLSHLKEKFVRYLPIGLIVALGFIGLMVVAVMPDHLGMIAKSQLQHLPANYSNTEAMGTLLYTRYLYPFEIAGPILLVAIISAIVLAFPGRRKNAKRQSIAKQHLAKKADRLRIVKMKAETHDSN